MYSKVIFLSLISVIVADKVRYDDYALYKVEPQNEEQLNDLKDLYTNSEDLDFWVPPFSVGDYVSVVSSPDYRNEFEHFLAKRSIPAQVTVENIQEAFDNQLLGRRKRDVSRQLYWTAFQTMEGIYEWFEYLAETYSFVSVVHIGQSFEGRSITGLRVSRSSTGRAFVLLSGEVGADWLSPTVVTYITDQLVRGEDPEALAASENFDWYIIPVSNPDGLNYTQNAERVWVKNRRPINANAVGVDLTRNWNSQWGVSGGSFTPADNNYIGLGPFSEIETRDIARYIEGIGSSITGFLSFRGFGQRFVVPFAHTTDPLYNYDEMIIIGRRAMGSLAVKYNTQYLVGTSLEVFTGATGNVGDWAKYRFNPPIVGTFALRDTGTWGYTLPVAWVQPSCEETYDAVMAILREARFINVV